MQAEASNRPLVLRSRGVVLSELGKGRTGSGQVGIMELNVSEPLLKCRKQLRRRQNRSGRGATGSVPGGTCLLPGSASGMEPARPWSGLFHGTWEPVVPMRRENRKWRPHERESTDAGHGDGDVCSSAEGVVMTLERRGVPVRSRTWEQPATGELR